MENKENGSKKTTWENLRGNYGLRDRLAKLVLQREDASLPTEAEWKLSYTVSDTEKPQTKRTGVGLSYERTLKLAHALLTENDLEEIWLWDFYLKNWKMNPRTFVNDYKTELFIEIKLWQ